MTLEAAYNRAFHLMTPIYCVIGKTSIIRGKLLIAEAKFRSLQMRKRAVTPRKTMRQVVGGNHSNTGGKQATFLSLQDDFKVEIHIKITIMANVRCFILKLF